MSRLYTPAPVCADAPDWDDDNDTLDEIDVDDGGDCMVFRNGRWLPLWQVEADDAWTDADEAALEAWEEERRERLALANEY